MRDPYLYDDVDVMKNKLGIKNSDELEKAESDIIPINLSTLDKYEDGKFDFEKLRSMHKHIFGDIYEWAGQPRTINIEKSETVLNGLSVQYCNHELIEIEAKKVINEINKVDWKKLNFDKKAEIFSRLTAQLWQVHAFREGNTRTTISFMTAFAKSKDINIDKDLLKQNAGYVRGSLVLASIGEYSEHNHLIRIIKDAMQKPLSISERLKAAEETAKKRVQNQNIGNDVKKQLDINKKEPER